MDWVRKALAALPLFAVVISLGCLGNGGGNGELILVEDGDILDQALCSQKGLDSQVTVFHSPSCGACLRTIPVLEEIESETDHVFEFIDITTERERVLELGVAPGHIPAVMIGCEVHVGYKDKETFLGLMS